jgi:hypothetical protein
MRSLLALLTIPLLSLGASACGGAAKSGGSALRASTTLASGNSATGTSSTSAAQSVPPKDHDEDRDGSPNSRYDSDDYAVLTFGHEAGTADRRVITALAKGFYAAAAAEDGAKACSLIYSLLAESVPETYGEVATGPPELRGKTCAVVMTKLFKRDHQELIVHNATLKVTGVRVEAKIGYVLLSFKGVPDRHMALHREFGVWKIDSLIAQKLI